MAVVMKKRKARRNKVQRAPPFKGYTYLELKLETGRTHQIRVHMSFIGHPLVGDPKYGPAGPISI